MSQGLRDMLANRKFAIPLIGLLALCFIGLLMIGIVIIFQPGKSAESVAQATDTATVAVTDTPAPTWTPSPTWSPTPRPSPTLVPVGTVAGGGATQPTAGATAAEAGTPVATVSATQEVKPTAGAATAAPTAGATAAQTTAPPESDEDELAQTGVGWGLVLVSGVGLAMLAIAAHRMRLTG